MGKKILVTGASGFVGSFLVEKGLDLQMSVWAGMRTSSSKRYLQDERISFIELDYHHPEILFTQLESFKREHGKWDYIIHCAGVTKCRHKEEFEQTNFFGFSRLLDILRKTEPSLFGIVRGGKVIEQENDVYTVLFPKTGAVYAGLLARDEYKEKVDAALSQAAGRPSKFNAVLEGKVKDNTLEARQEEQAREMQKEENLNKMIDMFGRENIVMDADI